MLFLSFCGSPVSPDRSDTSPTAGKEGHFGEEISPEDAIDGQELIVRLSGTDSVYVTLKGAVTSRCKKSGCWMDLDLSGGKVIRVTFRDNAFVIPLDTPVVSAVVEGWAWREIIPVEALRRYALEEGKSAIEVEAITEPDTSYFLEASGVIID